MPQRPQRTDAARAVRVPTPHLARQLAEAAATQAAPATEAAAATSTSHATTAQPDDGNGSGCHELPHTTELQVRRHLLGQSSLTFSSLVVRRMNNGVCLQGVVEICNDEPDFDRLVREVAAVEKVVSQLVVRPRKG